VAFTAACGGGEQAGGGYSRDAGPDAPPAAGGAQPAPGAAGAGGGGTGTPVALGDSVFHGQAGGGTCFVCHGQDGKGTAAGPDLTDKEWLNGDGSEQFIAGTVTNGVPKPKKFPAPMPPMGGATLSPDHVKAVAAYVHSLGGGS
jgi:mono/diheme cytochrome c family protein